MIDLLKYKDEIRSKDPLHSNLVEYSCYRWEKEFDNKKMLGELPILNGGKISRQLIIDFYRNYYEGNVSSSANAFLLTMIWGYNTPGYGPYRVNKFMTTQTEAIVKDSLQLVKSERIKEAFNLLMSIEGLSISFVSKVLYFSARACGIKKYPLIFDIQVSRALVSLASKGILNGILDVSPSKKFSDYDTYNSLIHKWAEELDVEPEKVEYFIFTFPFNDKKRRNKY
jgi:hypothetical protein